MKNNTIYDTKKWITSDADESEWMNVQSLYAMMEKVNKKW